MRVCVRECRKERVINTDLTSGIKIALLFITLAIVIANQSNQYRKCNMRGWEEEREGDELSSNLFMATAGCVVGHYGMPEKTQASLTRAA